MTPSDDTAAPGGWLILCFAIACGVTVANLYYAQPLVGPISDSFGLDVSAAGTMLTLLLFGYVLSLLFLAPLGDLVENKSLILTALGCLIAALLAAAAAPSAAIFMAAMLLLGLSAVGTQMILPMVAHLAPAQTRGQTVGTVMSGLLFGILLARPLSSLVAGSFGWRGMFVLSAIMMCGVLALMAVALPRRMPQHSLTYGALIRSLWQLMLTTPVLQRRAAYQCLLFGTFNLFWTAMPLVLEQPPFSFGHLAMSGFLLSGAGGALVAPLAGRLADRGRGQTLTAASMLAVLAGFVLVAVAARFAGAPAVTLFVLAGLLVDAGTQANVVAGQRAIFALSPDIRSRLNALFLACTFFGGAIGSGLAGYAVARGGVMAIAVIGGSAALAALALFGVERARRRG